MYRFSQCAVRTAFISDLQITFIVKVVYWKSHSIKEIDFELMSNAYPDYYVWSEAFNPGVSQLVLQGRLSCRFRRHPAPHTSPLCVSVCLAWWRAADLSQVCVSRVTWKTCRLRTSWTPLISAIPNKSTSDFILKVVSGNALPCVTSSWLLLLWKRGWAGLSAATDSPAETRGVWCRDEVLGDQRMPVSSVAHNFS